MDKELEKKLWAAADQLRGSISSEEYMYIVIGILFLKYMSEKFDKAKILLKTEYGSKYSDELLKNKDVLKVDGKCPFFIPQQANWNYISGFASSKEIGQILDRAFILIENYNPELKGLFDKEYNSEKIDQGRLGKVVTEFSEINMSSHGQDIVGRVYEYFLGNFFLKQGQKGGEFYTPKSIVKLLTDIIDIKEGTIYDPCFGTGGMFIQAKQHMIDKKYDINRLNVYGQEFSQKTWKLAKINLFIHGFDADDVHFGNKPADTFLDDQHKNWKEADFVLANPPFNFKKYGKEELENDSRFKYGLASNANYAWIQHIIDKLNSNGVAGIVLANGSISAGGKEEAIRAKLLQDNKVEAIISLPDKLFYTTGIPACIWIFNNNKSNQKVLMVNAAELVGNMLSKKLRELTDENINEIVKFYQKHKISGNVNQLGKAKSVSLLEIEENNWSLVPGRYVGFVEEVIDKEVLKKEIAQISQELNVLFDEFQEMIPKVKDAIKKIKD